MERRSRMAELEEPPQRLHWEAQNTGSKQNCARDRRAARRGIFISWLPRAQAEHLLRGQARVIVQLSRRRVDGKL